MKILLLADAASFHTERFYAELQKQGCEVLLASLEKGIVDAVTLQKKGFIQQFYYRFAVPQIRSLIKTFNPDIISAHFASGYGHIAALAKNKFTPLALNLWGSDILIVPKKSMLHRYKTKYALKNAQYVFADSQYLIDEAKKIFPFSNSSVFPWGVENEIFDLYKQDFILSKPLKIIVPRAHEHVYNNLFIVNALQDLIKSDKIQITFPAFGSQYEAFKEAAASMVGEKIKYYAKAERNNFLKLASTHDVYLSASLSDSSPVSLIESMALGLIPVVMRIDGVKEWVSNENGFMFENEEKSLSMVVENLLNSSDDFIKLREQNKEKVKQSALFENNIADQLAIFKNMIEKVK